MGLASPQPLFRLLALGDLAEVDGDPFVGGIDVHLEPPADEDPRP